MVCSLIYPSFVGWRVRSIFLDFQNLGKWNFRNFGKCNFQNFQFQSDLQVSLEGCSNWTSFHYYSSFPPERLVDWKNMAWWQVVVAQLG